MTIKRLSKKIKAQTKLQEQDLTDSFINNGGKTVQETKNKKDFDARFTLRIPQDMIQKIDVIRKQRVGKVSRNSWILEAISEKLDL